MRFILSALAGLLVALLGLEGMLHLFPVNSGIRMADSTAAAPFAHYIPNQPYQYSYGWAMGNAKASVSNAEGIANSHDPVDHANALVIGDSFIEAFMLHYEDTVQGRLDAALSKVYSVGVSGNGLADSLVIARHYIPRIHPKTVVMFVEAGDLGLIDQKAGRGHNYFTAGTDGLSVAQTPYKEPASKRLVLRSALLRYAYYNLKAPELFAGQRDRPVAQARDPGHAGRRDAMLRFYLSQLHELQRTYGTRFVFLVDGDRNAIYSPKAPLNWQGDDRQTLFAALAASGFAAVDMQPLFEQHWRVYRERMDFLPMDGHWNPVAHRLAADALLAYLR